MTIDDFLSHSIYAVMTGTDLVLDVPKNDKLPKGFPRGILLSKDAEGVKHYSFDASKVIAWVAALVKSGQVKFEFGQQEPTQNIYGAND